MNASREIFFEHISIQNYILSYPEEVTFSVISLLEFKNILHAVFYFLSSSIGN